MNTALEKPSAPTSQTVERVLVEGDLSKLSTEQRLAYYRSVCSSLGLNPLTKPFAYLNLNGKLQLYALRDATDQLRKIHHVSVEIIERQMVDDLYVVRAKATLPDGRADESLGAVNVNNLRGEAKANALMKGETKAKRRVTLSICGLGWLDETEAETIPNALPKVDGPIRTEGQLAAVSAAEEVDTLTGELQDDGPYDEDPDMEDDAPALPDGLYVINVDDTKRGTNKRGPWTLYKIELNDGRRVSTFDHDIGADARRALNDNCTVDVEVSGKDITAFRITSASNGDKLAF